MQRKCTTRLSRLSDAAAVLADTFHRRLPDDSSALLQTSPADAFLASSCCFLNYHRDIYTVLMLGMVHDDVHGSNKKIDVSSPNSEAVFPGRDEGRKVNG
jgi:hypothetical protein